MNKVVLWAYYNLLNENQAFFSENDYNAIFVLIMDIKNDVEQDPAKWSELEDKMSGLLNELIQ
jgi:hypothetical protein